MVETIDTIFPGGTSEVRHGGVLGTATRSIGREREGHSLTRVLSFLQSLCHTKIQQFGESIGLSALARVCTYILWLYDINILRTTLFFGLRSAHPAWYGDFPRARLLTTFGPL